MANVLFPNAQGQVIAVEEAGLPSLLQISLGGGASPFTGYISMKAIITRIAMKHSPNVNLRHMVGNAVHISVFGDKIGPATVTGIAIGAPCGDSDKLGIEHVAAYYESNKASAQEDPIKLTIGTTSYKGYLLGLSTDVADPKTNVWQFSLDLVIVPPRPKWKPAETTPISINEPATPVKPPSAFPPTGSPNDPLKQFTRLSSPTLDRGGAPVDYVLANTDYTSPATAGPRQSLTQGFTLHA